MKKDKWIFIITKSGKYRVVYKHSRRIKNLRDVVPILDWNFTPLDPESKLVPGMYIVFHNYIELLERDDWGDKKSQLYILTHKFCQLDKNAFSKKGFKNVKKGKHEPEPAGKYYPEVIKILESGKSEDEVYEGVWNAVFATDKVLEIKKELMLLCMCEDWINTNWDTIKSNQHYPKVKDFIEIMAGAHYRDTVYQKNYLGMAKVLELNNPN